VVVALHRGSGAATLDVPTTDSWAQGCGLAKPLVGVGSAAVQADGFRLKLDGNDVLIAECE
jgi:hypothetical protein